MVSTIFFSDLLLAALSFACWIVNSLVVLDARNIAVQEEEVKFISIVLFLEGVIDLGDQVKVTGFLLSLGITIVVSPLELSGQRCNLLVEINTVVHLAIVPFLNSLAVSIFKTSENGSVIT
jgi:hypothetical protein